MSFSFNLLGKFEMPSFLEMDILVTLRHVGT